MIKKTYSISGFDCANCAAKAEKHLNEHCKIRECHLDFASDKLYITYEEKELSIKEIKDIIREVETDEINISEDILKKNNRYILSKENIFLLIRILISVIAIIITMTILKEDRFFWINFGINLGVIILISYDIYHKVINNIIHLENPIDEYLLITLASIGAFVIASIERSSNEFFEAVMVLILFQVGQLIESYSTLKSKQAINDALDLRVETANLITGDDIEKVSPNQLKVGDKIIVVAGENIPVDGEVIEGEGYLDMSSLTGEFVPVRVNKGSKSISGSLLIEGSLTIKVEKTYENSTVYQLIELISTSGERKSKADKFVTKFARIYTPTIFVISLLTILIGGLITNLWIDYIILGLKMLVIACPCAIVISVPLAYFSAIGLASKNGIVIKGSNYLDQLNNIKSIYTDKTGTLTKGTFDIIEINENNGNNDNLLKYLQISEFLSNHPIGRAIAKDSQYIDKNKITDFVEYVGLGVKATYDTDSIISGSDKLLENNHIEFAKINKPGVVIYCAVNEKYIGYVILGDKVKENSKLMVDSLKKKGINTVLLSGDKTDNVIAFANQLGIKEYYSNLSPKDKADILEKNKSNKYAVAYIGDGVNDAATIASSDVGFAMGAIGSDIAVNNADIVIMNDDPYKVYQSIKIAHMARNISLFNIIFAISIKVSIELAALLTSTLGYRNAIPMWAAVLADTGLTVILVINSLLLLYRKINKKSAK